MKLKKAYGWIIMRLSDNKKNVIVDKTETERSADSDSIEELSKKFSTFISALPPNECRYAVFDFFYQVDGTSRNKIVFINWYACIAHRQSRSVFRW